MAEIIEFPRQKSHWAMQDGWKLLRTKLAKEGSATLLSADTDIELGDFVYFNGTDGAVHRMRVTEADELAHPVGEANSPARYHMLVTVVLAEIKVLTEDCDITNI